VSKAESLPDCGALTRAPALLSISSALIEFHNFLLLLMSIQNFSAGFQSLPNFGNFGFIIRNRWQKIKKVNIAMTSSQILV
jgi:hypothetical protein